MSKTAKTDKVVSMREAIATHVADDCSIAIEGFTGFICFAAGHEIIRQRRCQTPAEPAIRQAGSAEEPS